MFEAHTPCDDGVGTFFKTDKFQLKNYEVFGFNEMLGEVIELDKFKNRDEHNQRLGQYTLLQDLKSGKELVIVNVHLISGENLTSMPYKRPCSFNNYIKYYLSRTNTARLG